MALLDAPVSALGAWGARCQKLLAKRGIYTCRDILLHFPYRIDDFSNIVSIAHVQSDMAVTVCGTIQLIANRRSPRMRKIVTEALVADQTGSIKAIWFNQPFLTRNLHIGDKVALAGKVDSHFFDLQFVSPAYEKIIPGKESLNTGRCVPVYSLGEGISQKIFRSLEAAALERCLPNVSEWMPQDVLGKEGLIGNADALRAIHFPRKASEWEAARTRLAFDELLLLQLARLKVRNELQSVSAAPIRATQAAHDAFIQSLPFTLTRAQCRAIEDILSDLKKKSPMNRLLEGDVGSGKTVVAVVAIAHAAAAGLQTALMAPTEIVARQHFQTLYTLLKKNISAIALVTSSSKMAWRQEEGIKKFESKKDAEQLRGAISSGVIPLIIGTHALLEERVGFHNLGLVIIDEQHRFGVRQRKILREKNASGSMPHLLSMTATPIPRSLALTLYGDLDLSIIDEMPPRRKKVITKLVPARYREWTYDFVKKMIAKGSQAFIICPIIDPSDVLGVRSVNQEYKRLAESVFLGESIGILHGKLKPERKEAVMNDFAAGRISILVATTVIEVGVDIPNANIMMIEGAERFGLAQLHQLRGRIGRSYRQAYCFLLPTTEDHGEKGRLKAVISCTNGFELAEKDLELRGSGEMYGMRQSGLPDLKLASLNDRELIQKTREYAKELIEKREQYPRIAERLKEYQEGELRD